MRIVSAAEILGRFPVDSALAGAMILAVGREVTADALARRGVRVAFSLDVLSIITRFAGRS